MENRKLKPDFTPQQVDFSLPPHTPKSLEYINSVLLTNRLGGNGEYAKACQDLLVQQTRASAAILTPSCTASLEMALLLLDIRPGDEVIVPSFTFTSTANAVVLLGATPVFVDIEPEYMNLDPRRIEEAVTSKTKAMIPVHYAGVACDMSSITPLANFLKIDILEDAAQAIGARHGLHALGSLGRFGALSFHESKNLGCGEGGALLIRDPEDLERAEIARDKGTNRTSFLRGQVNKYTWENRGSSYLISEVTAALLRAQLEDAKAINARRMKIWNFYQSTLSSAPSINRVARVQRVPAYADHNAHIFYLVMNTSTLREQALALLRAKGVYATSHYEPLHLSPAGQRFGRCSGTLNHSESLPGRILRLPIYADMEDKKAQYVVDTVEQIFRQL